MKLFTIQYLLKRHHRLLRDDESVEEDRWRRQHAQLSPHHQRHQLRHQLVHKRTDFPPRSSAISFCSRRRLLISFSQLKRSQFILSHETGFYMLSVLQYPPSQWSNLVEVKCRQFQTAVDLWHLNFKSKNVSVLFGYCYFFLKYNIAYSLIFHSV